MALHKVHINLTGGGAGPGNEVLLDGVELRGVQRVVVEAGPYGPTIVRLDLVPHEVLMQINGADVVKQINDIRVTDGLTETTSLGDQARTYWYLREQREAVEAAAKRLLEERERDALVGQ
jgi:hypothetical protein